MPYDRSIAIPSLNLPHVVSAVRRRSRNIMGMLERPTRKVVADYYRDQRKALAEIAARRDAGERIHN